jgi:DNA-binding transcriptional MerR regulator
LRGKRAGFALEEIKEMLDLYNLKDNQLTQLRVSSAKMQERLVALKQQRIEIDEAVEDLERTIVVVNNMLKEREAGNAPKAASGS